MSHKQEGDFFVCVRGSPTQEPPPSPFWELTRTMVWGLPGRKLGPWSEFPFLYRFNLRYLWILAVQLNSPWSEFWSEFPHFMGMGVGFLHRLGEAHAMHTACECRLHNHRQQRTSGKRQEAKPELSGPDTLWWGRGLPREGVGAKKFGMTFQTKGNRVFAGISLDFAGISWSCQKVWENRVCVQFFAPNTLAI